MTGARNDALCLREEIDAVVFDMDGLLIDSERPLRAATLAAAARVGREMDDAFYASLIGVATSETWARIAEHLGGAAALDEFRAALDAEIAARHGEVALMAGVEALLAHLDEAGLPMAVCTNSRRASAERHLAAAGIRERFRAVVTRDDVVQGKPHPEPYLRAAGALGVAPARCLALEDSHNGIRAAHAAGMIAVMVPDLLPATDDIRALCRHVADDLHAVRGLLATRSGGLEE
ncbi:HAD family hydrolase [Coralloluteibacterium thermophilus]|uniref:HAD family hydrolase n=1 Tax=Coralloluteibacterium thermophilum TaxID=2707049 RepID=A0ABV9NKV5_9GAMM